MCSDSTFESLLTRTVYSEPPPVPHFRAVEMTKMPDLPFLAPVKIGILELGCPRRKTSVCGTSRVRSND